MTISIPSGSSIHRRIDSTVVAVVVFVVVSGCVGVVVVVVESLEGKTEREGT